MARFSSGALRLHAKVVRLKTITVKRKAALRISSFLELNAEPAQTDESPCMSMYLGACCLPSGTKSNHLTEKWLAAAGNVLITGRMFSFETDVFEGAQICRKGQGDRRDTKKPRARPG